MKNLFYLYFISALLFASCDETISIEEVVITPPPEEVIPDDDLESNGKEPITDMPYSQIPDKDYTIELDRWDIPNDGTDAIKTTDNLQAAIDWAVAEEYGKIHLPAGHYLIGKYQNAAFQSGIKLKSNMAFLLDKNAVIEMTPNELRNYYVVAVTSQEYVVISGGTILGDRYDHTYTGNSTHEGGHLIAITDKSKHVTVENMNLGEGTGDGILLEAFVEDGSVENIDIRRNNIYENRRQGISIVGGKYVIIEDNEIHHTNGTSPQYGIDIESEICFSGNIEIISNHFHHNKGGSIVNFDASNLLIEDNIIEEGEGNDYVGPALVYWHNTAQTIRFNKFIYNDTDNVNKGNAIVMYSNGNPKTNSETTYIYENTCLNSGFYMYSGSDLEIYDNDITNGHLAFKDMKNLTLNNNNVTHTDKCRAMRFTNIIGSARGNTLNGDTVALPFSSESWGGYGCDMVK